MQRACGEGVLSVCEQGGCSGAGGGVEGEGERETLKRACWRRRGKRPAEGEVRIQTGNGKATTGKALQAKVKFQPNLCR